eukprot:scaffold23668_cov101-Isochrysis_galbana.AAC.2
MAEAREAHGGVVDDMVVPVGGRVIPTQAHCLDIRVPAAHQLPPQLCNGRRGGAARQLAGHVHHGHPLGIAERRSERGIGGGDHQAGDTCALGRAEQQPERLGLGRHGQHQHHLLHSRGRLSGHPPAGLAQCVLRLALSAGQEVKGNPDRVDRRQRAAPLTERLQRGARVSARHKAVVDLVQKVLLERRCGQHAGRLRVERVQGVGLSQVPSVVHRVHPRLFGLVVVGMHHHGGVAGHLRKFAGG